MASYSEISKTLDNLNPSTSYLVKIETVLNNSHSMKIMSNEVHFITCKYFSKSI